MAPTPSRPANTRSKHAVDSPLAMALSASAEKKARAETRRQKALQKKQERKAAAEQRKLDNSPSEQIRSDIQPPIIV